MAQACTITEEDYGSVKKVKWAWTSAADGSVSSAVTTTTGVYSGEIRRLVTIPAAAADAPTDDYDIVINDEDGCDVLMGAGANRDVANTEQVLASSLGIVANDKLALVVAAAGDSNKGTVIVYIR